MNEDEKIKALIYFLRKSKSEGKHVKMSKLIEKCEKEKNFISHTFQRGFDT